MTFPGAVSMHQRQIHHAMEKARNVTHRNRTARACLNLGVAAFSASIAGAAVLFGWLLGVQGQPTAARASLVSAALLFLGTLLRFSRSMISESRS